MSECPHGGDPYCCPPCQNKGSAGQKLAPKLTSNTAQKGMTIEARFKSQCPRCHRLIDIGEQITYTEDGWICPDH